MRRNVSTSRKHTQQHNSKFVPARVPVPCLFGQVASMRNQQTQKGTAQFQTQRANARHRPTFPHTNCETIPFLDVRNNVQAQFPSFRWSSPLAPHSNPSPSHSAQRPTTGESSLATLAHWLRNQLMYASRQAQGYDRNAVCDGPRLSLVAGAPCNLLVAAADGISHADVRRYSYSSSHTTLVGWGKSAPDCVHDSQGKGTRLRTDAARVTISHAHW